ncbi:MAG: hypothetical protein COW88_01190 [Candidatus Lloydbacteria bacterium CG22_combo_CG10-13_8_21_14_all_47_15]|uniref:Uncharacterized protein n=1 Tax=Candidatus Lloydbacteria bacterium CG22_combo_CG10-13_8_21_14_all_47_15 TaxID=1974635 RepID=A0A2H0CWA3_9BACT|nr:MAG: hypothetical protein COW88_01190 [Candidatus Lloydbacteria bacterium CG22_combo_CG10-13_8_21_14_all_47_15]
MTYKVDQEKWRMFSKEIQLKNIAAELSRAAQSGLRDASDVSGWGAGAYERAISLIDASIADTKWEEKRFLYQLRDAVASLYVSMAHPAVSNFLSRELSEKRFIP